MARENERGAWYVVRTMRDVRAAVLVVALVCAGPLACSRGGAPSSAPPAAAATTSPEPTAATPDADAPAAEPADPAAIQASLVTTVLDSRPMVMYLHPEVEGRVPVGIGGPALEVRTREVTAQGVPVKLCHDEATAEPGNTCVIFERIEITGPFADVVLYYPIEGVEGTFRLVREREGWKLLKAQLVER
jgi:hypothetical protein